MPVYRRIFSLACGEIFVGVYVAIFRFVLEIIFGGRHETLSGACTIKFVAVSGHKKGRERLEYKKKNIKRIKGDGYRKVDDRNDRNDRNDAGYRKCDGYRKDGDRKDFFCDIYRLLEFTCNNRLQYIKLPPFKFFSINVFMSL